jgi:DNA-binding Xre family transcriptional regulator
MVMEYAAIADELWKWTAKRGYTVSGLAKATGIRGTNIRHYFSGAKASLPTIETICRTLDVSVAEFLNGKPLVRRIKTRGKARKVVENPPVMAPVYEKPCGVAAVLRILGADYIDAPIEFRLADNAFNSGSRRLSGNVLTEQCFGGGGLQ